jgi:dTDP-4-dehydrorhamnose reductase
MPRARALITGGEGQLGRALVALLDGAQAPGREALDVADADAVCRSLREHRPELVVNAAAYNDVDGAETDRERAFAVNAHGPAHLARACEEVGARIVHVSSDYVFDGLHSRPYEVDDPPAPLGVYGASKLAGERAVLEARCPRLVVRTSGVFGRGGSRVKGGSFVDRILSRARQGQPLKVVSDQVFSPTYAPDLAAALVALVDRDAAGLVHVTNAGHCSWHELAVETVRLAGIDATVGEMRSSELDRPARRPAYSVLSNARSEALGLRPLRSWRDALAEFLGR